MNKRRLLIVSFIIFLALILFKTAILAPRGKMLFGGDVFEAYYYWKGYLRSSVLSGVIPFWNPYNFSGTPFLAHPNINIFYPPNVVFILFSPDRAFLIYEFIHIVIAGCSMYWLLRQYTGVWGALSGSVSFAFSGYFAARIFAGHPEYIDTASWFPLAFGLMRRLLLSVTKRNIVTATLGLSILLLSGNEYFFLLTAELVLLYWVFLTLSDLIHKKNAKKGLIYRTFGIGLSFFFAFGLTAVEIIPRLQFLRSSLRSVGVPYAFAGSGSLPWEALRLFIQPFFYGTVSAYRGPWPNLSEYMYYAGVIPLGVIVFYLVRLFYTKIGKKTIEKNSTEVGYILFVIIPIFILISLGMNLVPNIHEWLWQYTPFYKSLRFPVRHLFVVMFLLCLSSGIIIGSIKNKVVKIALLLFVCLDLLSVGQTFITTSDPPTKRFDVKLISYLQQTNTSSRLLPDYAVISSVRNDFDFGAASTNKVFSTSDYNSMVLTDYYRFIDVLNKNPGSSVQFHNVEIPPPNPLSPLINFLNVKYILDDKSIGTIGREYPAKFTKIMESDRYALYENATVLPRFFLVNVVSTYPSEHDLSEALLHDQIDLGKSIGIVDSRSKYKSTDCPAGPVGEVQVVSYTPNTISLRVNSNCNAYLSTSEVYYPGWRVDIDGKRNELLKSNMAFRSTYVPKGDHMITFYYYPAVYMISGVISFLFGLSLVMIYKKRSA